MKVLFLSIVAAILVITSCEPPPPLRNYLPPRNTYLPPANQQISTPQKLPPGTLIIQVRSDSGKPRLVIKRGPPQGKRHLPGLYPANHAHVHRPVHFVNPLKFALSPHFLQNSKPNIGFTHVNGRQPTRVTKIKLNFPKSPSGYVYENPFSPAPAISNYPNKIELVKDYRFGPIHTIPAPNLAHGSGFSGNHHHHYANHHNQHQYQVTEDATNDQILKDQYSGQLKYFAPDPDPSLPVRKIPPSADPYSMPSDGSSYPADLKTRYLPPYQIARPPSTSYGVPLNPIPVPNLVDGMPLSIFNPSYLVSQSKNLYDQHKNILSKPEASSPASHYGTDDLTQHVASDGQIIHAPSEAIIPVTPTPQTDLVVQHLALAPQLPSYAALVAQPPQSSGVSVSYETHTVQPQISHNLHFDNSVAQGGFIVSNYFGAQGSDLQHYSQPVVDTSNHQQQYVDVQPTAQPLVSPTAHPQIIVTPSASQQAQYLAPNIEQQQIQYFPPNTDHQGQYFAQSTEQPYLAQNADQQYLVQSGSDQQQQNVAPNHNPYYVDLSQHQTQNQQTLELAQHQLQQQQQYEAPAQEYATNQNIQQDLSAYEQHQSLLEQQFGSTFGGQDSHYQQVSNFQKRSDQIDENESQDGEINVTVSSESESKEETTKHRD